MDFKNQIIQEYLTQGGGYQKLAEKYGISRTTICKWVQVYQGIHNLPPSEKQQKYYYISGMNSSKKKDPEKQQQYTDAMQEKLATLEKQLQWEKLRADALDTMINIAEKQTGISIRKKPGSQQSKK